MSDIEKNIDRKVTRMQHEYQDLVIKTQFLKTSKVKIKKDIEYFKNIINKLAFIYDVPAD